MARKAVILTALQIEQEAVVAHLRDVRQLVHERESVYRQGTFGDGPDPWLVWVAEIGAGNERAAAEVERLIEFAEPEVAIFVGVAGAIKDLDHGDVVASTEVYSYESGKDRDEFVEARPKVVLPAYGLLQRARYEASQGSWRSRIRDSTGRQVLPGVEGAVERVPTAKLGPIAAGPKVLASTRSPLYKFLRDHYGDAIAVEMEGYGFLLGVHMNRQVEGIVIRGISDKLADKSGDADADWQPVAARHAAAFAFQVLAEFRRFPGSAGSGPGRDQLLNSAQNDSMARSVARWQAAGVKRDEAIKMAADDTIGASETNHVPSADHPLRLLTGELGVGKSLRLDRWHQRTIHAAATDPRAPIPAYIEVNANTTDLFGEIDRQAAGLGEWRVNGVALAVDRLERAGGSGEDLLGQARRLVVQFPNSRVLLTTRPFLRKEPEEEIRVPELSPDESLMLISRFAARTVGKYEMSGWPKSLQSAARRPLFAILCGLDLLEKRDSRSVAALLGRLVQRALGPHELAEAPSLRSLAVKSVDAGYASIRASDVGAPEVVGRLLETTLVIGRNETIRFSLDVLTDWFAAHALAAGEVPTGPLFSDVARLNGWRYPLTIAVGIFPHDVVSAFMRPLASLHPAFAAQVVSEGMEKYASSQSTGLPAAPPAAESGERIRECMKSWVGGLEASTAQLIAPVGGSGALQPLGIRIDGSMISAGWNDSKADLPNISELPADPLGTRSTDDGWNRVRWARPATVSAWAWIWTLAELHSAMKGVVDRRGFAPLRGPLLTEEIWHQAAVLMKKSSLFSETHPLEELRRNAARFGQYYTFGHRNRSYQFTELREGIEVMMRSGAKELRPPWPGPDQCGGRFVWSGYSPERLRERMAAVLSAALEAYGQLVRVYLPRFATHLPLASLMPVRLVGTELGVDPASEVPPYLRWYFEPLPEGGPNLVAISLSGDGAAVNPKDEGRNMRLIGDLIRQRRPTTTMSASANYGAPPSVFGDRPATEIAYGWLAEDLKSVDWLG